MSTHKESETTAVMIVIMVAVIAITAYVSAALYFGWGISKSPSNWGPFGDYFGGIINPAIALAALYILVKATKYQKAEFVATRTHLENEAKKNEIYRVISHIDKKLNLMLSVDVKEETGGGELGRVTLGPLGHYLKPGWRARRGFYVVLGDSNLATQISRYLPQVRENIKRLEKYLDEYKKIAGEESSAVTTYFEDVYLPMKDACVEIEAELAK